MGAVSRKVANDLSDARRNRDEVHKNLERLLVGKALAYTSMDIAIQVKNTSVELTESCVQYIRFYRRVQEEKKMTLDIMERKVIVFITVEFRNNLESAHSFPQYVC